MNNWVNGFFIGLLSSCFLMQVAGKPAACSIMVTKGQVTTVTIGTYKD